MLWQGCWENINNLGDRQAFLPFDVINIIKMCQWKTLIVSVLYSCSFHYSTLFKYLKCHQDFKQGQVLRRKRENARLDRWLERGASASPFKSLLGSFLGSLSQSITCQIESLFTFWPVHPLLLNSTQSSSLLVFSLSLKLTLLPWLYWVGLPAQRNIVPSYTPQTLNKRRVTVSEMLSKLGGGKTTHYRVWSYSCKTKPPLCLSQVCHFPPTFAALLAFDSVDWRHFVTLELIVWALKGLTVFTVNQSCKGPLLGKIEVISENMSLFYKFMFLTF